MRTKICLLVALSFIFGCSNYESPVTAESSAKTEQKETSDVNVLTSATVSDPELNPYSVKNMNKAMRKAVLARSTTVDPDEVESMELKPNYLYVRFLVGSSQELAELRARDTTIVYFTHPLDYKPIRKPVVYKDPTLPEGVKAYFASVPVDFDFGSVKHDVIEELFLVEPLDDDIEEGAVTDARTLLRRAAPGNPVMEKLEEYKISLQEIEWTSFQMTGNDDGRMMTPEKKAALAKTSTYAWFLDDWIDAFKGTSKKFGGQLMFADTRLGVQPLVGMRVTGGYSFWWRTTYTDKDGKFKIPGTWDWNINYEANLDLDDFVLEDGGAFLEDLEIEKNDMSSDWNEIFIGKYARWCIVWDAAHQYWYGNNWGLHRPKMDDWSRSRESLIVYGEKAFSDCETESVDDHYCKDNMKTMGSEAFVITRANDYGLYEAAIFAIALTSHNWYMEQSNSGDYNDLSFAYRNAYAAFVRNYFAEKKYGERGLKDGMQFADDLIDNDGDSPCSEDFKDNVFGFDVVDIENAFFSNKSFEMMEKYMIKRFQSEIGQKYTESDLDNLFECWGLI